MASVLVADHTLKLHSLVRASKAPSTKDGDRPGLLLDLSRAPEQGFRLTKESQTQLLALLNQVGPVAVVSSSEAVISALRLVLNPIGASAVVRMFDDREQAIAWLDEMKQKAAHVFTTDRPRGPEAGLQRLQATLDAIDDDEL